ncbi:hypothetical protein K450DRAFT_241356 [Umbelopsis ramanniana AG]|uniref:tRNA-uridine aminocarboxypropyltransferase 1 n=1 Tax=Umbelopsis ramanniana AG TaxID=1314678 RepID=A0AAD5E9W1_UMBRA|nr:uncharacterized protein K450DRAFT_241356 [Umbelopsis ramanniana AG]KAI8579517.1 hypothetical protein K450DRAFT_241356 [Umbelopsis ramanniana AG]
MSETPVELRESKKRPAPASESSTFDDLKIQDDSILHKHSDRETCPDCKKSAMYFCYRCFKPSTISEGHIPQLELPIPMDVIKHEQELDGKSTAAHAAVIAPHNVKIYNWQSIPQYENPEEVLLLFPGHDAHTLEEIPKGSFKKFVVIDGTWKQASKIVRLSPQLQNVRKVTIAPRKTLFWRYQSLSENYLATIEAIYYLYREYAEAYEMNGKPYDGRYDNLLFYFRYFYNLIQSKYKKENKKYTHRQREGYIQYDDSVDAKVDENKSVDA